MGFFKILLKVHFLTIQQKLD